ncbi:MAG: hypothetical protein DMF61_14160 [Blastocatellia bacterium AA13]|nr:MAG: hypothetical protein DMF61_14160 [Blastocatellia bacterium AA13]
MRIINRFIPIFIIVCAFQLPIAPVSAAARPEYLRQTGFSIPVVKRDSLLNGLSLMLIESPSTDGLRLHLRVNSGALFDLAGKGGLADFTAGMLLKGGGGLAAKNIEEIVEHYGIRISIKVTWDSTDVVMISSSNDIEAMLDLCARLVVSPSFEQAEFDAFKRTRVESLKKGPPAAPEVLKERALAVLFGAYPFGHPEGGTAESLSKIERTDLSYYHDRFYLANNSELLITGNTTLEEIVRISRAKLGAWKKGAIVPATFRTPEPPADLKLIVSDSPGAAAQAVVAQIGFSRRVPDYLAAAVMIEALAASNKQAAVSFGSEVSVHTEAEARYLAGPILTSVQAPPDKLAAAMDAILKNLRTFKNGQLDSQAIESAKQRVLDSFLRGVQSAAGVEDALLDIELYGLGRDYLLHFEERVNAVTPADCVKSAQKYVAPASSVLAAAGAVREIEPALKKLLTGGSALH